MGKFLQLRSELWPLIDIILCIYIEFIFRGGVSCLPAALLFLYMQKAGFLITRLIWPLVSCLSTACVSPRLYASVCLSVCGCRLCCVLACKWLYLWFENKFKWILIIQIKS